MIKPNTIIKGTCESYSNEGEGVIHFNKEVIFVKNLIIGETADIKIEYIRNKIHYGSIKKIYNLSNDRIKPLCPIHTSCGGCCFQALKYNKQLEYKTNKVKDAFLHIAKINANVNNCVGLNDNPYFYRNKAQVPFKKIKGKIEFGFYKSNTHILMPINECSIEDKRSNKILNSIKKLMTSFNIDPYDEDKRFGIIRHILIRTSYHFNEIMLTLVTNCDSFPSRNNFVKAIIKENPEITTVVQNINKRQTNVILGEQERILYGKGFIYDSICDLKYKISSKSFFQINPIQVQNLYKYIYDLNIFNKDQTLLDAYSGVGTIGITLANKVKEVLSVEIVKDAIKDGIINAKLNNINNVKFICDDASEYILKENKKLDIVVMDPPRKGSDDKFLNAIINAKPEYIIYVSCDPNTLARDIFKLKNNFEIKSIQPFDMFPMTYHVETVVILKLKSNTK